MKTTIRFSVECPHCGKMQTSETQPYAEIDGAILPVCTNCHHQFAIGWSIEIGVDVYKCDTDPADVHCSYSLTEDWDEEEGEENDQL